MNESVNEWTDETFNEQTNECTDGHRTQVSKDCEESLISPMLVQWVDMYRVARIFKGWVVTPCHCEGIHQILMSCLPPVVGCAYKRGGGLCAPHDPRSYAPDVCV